MANAAGRRYTFDDYLNVEEMSIVRYEFIDGSIVAMPGDGPEHSAIGAAVSSILGIQLRDRPCGVYGCNLRVRVRATGLATYPDASVFCGRLELDPNDPSKCTVTNPTVLVEVLSPSTEDYDRGDKIENYKQIDSLQEVVFVSHDAHRIEVIRRVGSSWKHFEFTEGAAELTSLKCTLPVEEVYRDPLTSA